MNSKTVLIGILAAVFIVLVVTPEELLTEPSILGAAVAKVFVRGLEVRYLCNYTFEDGRNLIGIPCMPDNSSIDIVFANISSSLVSVHEYDLGNPQDPWSIYNPSLPFWAVQDLMQVQDTLGLWVYLNAAENLTVNGTIETPKVVGLTAGWNLIGYVSNRTRNITNALSTIDGDYSAVYGYNATTDQFEVFVPGGSNNSLSNLSYLRGYWINITNGTTWIIT